MTCATHRACDMGSTVETTYLTPTPASVVGAGAIFNLFGGYFSYNTAPTGEEADSDAIRRDWLVTSQDLKEAIRRSIAEVTSEQK